MPQTPAQRKAKAKYNAKTYKEIRIKPTIKEADAIIEHTKGTGETMTRFLVRAAQGQIKQDNEESKK